MLWNIPLRCMNISHHDWFNKKIKLPIARQDFQGRKNAGKKGRETRQLQNESETQNGIEVKNHMVELGYYNKNIDNLNNKS